MGALIEVKYFNSFLLKKVEKTTPTVKPVWNGSFGIPVSVGGYPIVAEADLGPNNWVIEESRIRGGYNNTSVDLGVKAYLVEDEPKSIHRRNSLIYSGIFNSRTGINNTNVFSVGEEITKSADPANGSIQKLFAEDTNLIVFQEAKVSRALIDKDAIYSAEGGGAITNINTTIGTIQPYAGNFGISRDPGSFAVYGYRKYFTDRDRNSILRLSKDGLTEISNNGMYDYFRDNLNSSNGSPSINALNGGFDIHNKQYVISISKSNSEYATLSFDERVLGWTSFFTYKPDQVFSLKNNFYSLKDGVLWKHYSPNVNRCSFYGSTAKSSVTFVFNPDVSMPKVFNTVNYEGSNGWQIESFVSDGTGADALNGVYELPARDKINNVYSYYQGSYDNHGNVYPTALIPPINRAGFDRKENKYFANLINSTSANQAEVLWGNSISGIKGYFVTVKISTDNVTEYGKAKELFAVSSNYSQSSY